MSPQSLKPITEHKLGYQSIFSIALELARWKLPSSEKVENFTPKEDLRRNSAFDLSSFFLPNFTPTADHVLPQLPITFTETSKTLASIGSCRILGIRSTPAISCSKAEIPFQGEIFIIPRTGERGEANNRGMFSGNQTIVILFYEGSTNPPRLGAGFASEFVTDDHLRTGNHLDDLRSVSRGNVERPDVVALGPIRPWVAIRGGRNRETKRYANEGVEGKRRREGEESTRKKKSRERERERRGGGGGGPIEGTHVSHLVAAATCSRASVVVPANPAPTTTTATTTTTTTTTTDNGRNSATRDALLVVATVAVVVAATVAVAAAAAAVAHVSRYARRIAPAPRHECSRLARCEN